MVFILFRILIQPLGRLHTELLIMDRNRLVTSPLVTDMSTRLVISGPISRMNEQHLNL